MDKLRLTEENIEAIQKAIKKAEGKATVRCLSAETLLKKVHRWEKVSARKPPKEVLEGVSLKVRASEERLLNDSKPVPKETVAYVEYGSVGWYLVEVKREPLCYHGWSVTALLTNKLQKYILERAMTA